MENVIRRISKIISIVLVLLLSFAATTNVDKIEGNDKDIPNTYNIDDYISIKYENPTNKSFNDTKGVLKIEVSQDGKYLKWEAGENILIRYVFVIEGTQLPQTGGVPATLFYGAGRALILKN